MSLLTLIFGESKREKVKKMMKNIGEYAVIQFSHAAYTHGVDTKELVLYRGGDIADSFPYSSAKAEELEVEHHIPVMDITNGSTIPEEFEQEPPHSIIMGRLRLDRWIE